MTTTKKDETPQDPEVQEEVEVTEAPEAAVEETEGARYIRIRAEAKEKAAVEMEKNAKAALRAKQKRLGSAPEVEGQADFRKAAAAIEKQINADTKKED